MKRAQKFQTTTKLYVFQRDPSFSQHPVMICHYERSEAITFPPRLVVKDFIRT